MGIEMVEQNIMDNEHKIYNYDSFKAIVGVEGMIVIRDYVEYITDKELYKEYSDNNYINEFLKDYALCALNDGRYNDLRIYADILHELDIC